MIDETASASRPRAPMAVRPHLMAAVLILVIGGLIVAFGPLVLDRYSVNVLTRSMLYAVVALTVDLLWGYLGILTFGQSVFFAAGAYAVGIVFTHMGFSPGLAWLALGIGVGTALVMALIVGWLAFWHGASPLYASVITLVLPIVCTQLIFSGGNFTGSSSGLSGFMSFDISTEAWFWIAGGFLVLMTTIVWVLVHSDAGRVLIAIRENEQRCKYLGLEVTRIKTVVFLFAAMVGALAGYLFAAYSWVVSPELAGFNFGTQLVIWTALGGRATVLGPVLGAIGVDYGSAQLSGDFPFIWQLIIGAVFVLVIIAFPRGLLPMIVSLFTRVFGPLLPRRAGTSREMPRIAAIAAGDSQGLEAGSGPILMVSGVRKSFGSLTVLDGVDFRAHAGELVSLVGPNGAGKTTLMRCIADGTERTDGTIFVNGHDIGRRQPEHCVALGVGRKFQTANVFDTLTVAECLRVARSRREWPSFWQRSNDLSLPQASLHVVETTGLGARLGDEVRSLSHGLKQALELAMVLALEPRVVLLDEPTAGLTKQERTQIGGLLTDLVRTQGLCVLLVEHDLGFVREISSRVIVLHQGRILLDGSVEEVVASELVRSVYAGASHTHGAG